MKKNHDPKLKFLYDYLPIIVFFCTYKFSDSPKPLLSATIYMIITTVIALIICYFLTRKIPAIALTSAIILGIFGGLTIFLDNEIFIKIKPTVINLIFAGILLFGFFSRKPLLSYLLEGQVKMPKESWLKLSLRWSLFFIFLAVLNEIIWRHTSTDFWVEFKVFGMMPLSLVFAVSQMPFMIREMKKSEQKF